MANLTRTPSRIACLDTRRSFIFSAVPSVDIEAGNPIYIHPVTGKAAKGDASASGTAHVEGIALQSVQAGQSFDYITKGPITGLDFSGVGYQSILYLSDDAGEIADAAGTVNKKLGRVKGATDDPNFTKYFEVDIDESIY